MRDSIDKPDTQAVFYCQSGTSWCCMPREGVKDLTTVTNTTCCSISDLQFTAPSPSVYTFAQDLATRTAIPADSNLATQTSNMQSTDTASPTNSQQAAQTTGNSSTTSGSNSRIGIYVGVPVGVVAFIALLAIGWLVLRKRRRTHKGPSPEAKQYSYSAHVDAERPSEMPNEGIAPPELPGIRAH